MTAPLAWWEHCQLDILSNIGMTEEAAYFREHPEEWREFRKQIGEEADRRKEAKRPA